MTTARISSLAALLLGAAVLLCWAVMFLAGHDVWHHAGAPDFWQLPGPPYHDLRAFAYAYYLLLPLCIGQMVAVAVLLRRMRTRAAG
jgi:hypothetical protein